MRHAATCARGASTDGKGGVMSKLINRRRLLIGSGAILSVAFLPGCASFPVIPKRPAPDARAGMSWISY